MFSASVITCIEARKAALSMRWLEIHDGLEIHDCLIVTSAAHRRKSVRKPLTADGAGLLLMDAAAAG
jgi:hypothetical protein